jgi:putative oxidoreductase
MKNNGSFIFRILLAFPFIFFGLHKFFFFADVTPPADPTAQAFLGAMFSSYLSKLVGATEIAAGLLLLSNRTTFLGSLLLVPITVNITLFHIAHDMPGNGIWLYPTLLHFVLIYFQRKRFASIFDADTTKEVVYQPLELVDEV